MKKFQNVSPMLMIVFSIVLLFWLIGCVHENNEFAVTFLVGESIEIITVNPRGTIPVLPFPNIPTDTYFGGWFTERDGHGDEFTAETKVESNLTVYAFLWAHSFGCDPENCDWIYIEPVIDYSLPQFYMEGLWAKNDSSVELTINTYAHFWAYFSGACPTCRPAVDPPMPVVRFHPFGRNSSIFFEFFLKSYEENIITIIAFNTEGNKSIEVEVSFSAIVSNNELTVNGLEGNLRNHWDDGYVELNNFNGIYTIMSRP